MYSNTRDSCSDTRCRSVARNSEESTENLRLLEDERLSTYFASLGWLLGHALPELCEGYFVTPK
jgi:hypothetical protein